MSNRIQLLSPLVANQIAAGEVIERPASVLKELLENSLDAGAKQIEIDLLKGGKQLIRIQDHGSGIHPDDLALALNRHATSKISELNDLSHLQSLGFRGEALASIAAVSRLRLISAIEGSDAYQITVAGETQMPEISLAAHPRGTTVVVEDLFFNAPVRRRFLRTDKTEFMHALDVIKRIALSRDNIAIKLIHDGKLILQLPIAQDLTDKTRRLSKICGNQFMATSQYFTQEAQGLILEGWINRTDSSYPHTDLQYFFLNGRMVRDKLINHALRIAAQDFLPAGRHLAYVLYFSCDPELVDVNVHPTKHEVRFQESRLIHDFLVKALQRVWHKPEVFVGVEEERAEYNVLRRPRVGGDPALNLDSRLRGNDGGIGHPIACIKNHLLVETKTGLLIIDVIAALKHLYLLQLEQSKLIAKPLLMPRTINISAKQLENLQAKNIDWKSLGMIWQPLSAQQIIIRQLPEFLSNTDLTNLFKALADNTETILATIAHYAATSKAANLTPSEMEKLLPELEKIAPLELRKITQTIVLS